MSAWYKRQEKRGSAPPWLRVHQCLIVLRNLGGICNVTDNEERQFPFFLVTLPSERFSSGMITYLLLQYDSRRSLTKSSEGNTMWKNTQCDDVVFYLCTCDVSPLALCLLTEGRLDVTKDGVKLLTVEPEDVFGELALLYNCTHTFSVSGITALCWRLGISTCIQIRTRTRIRQNICAL